MKSGVRGSCTFLFFCLLAAGVFAVQGHAQLYDDYEWAEACTLVVSGPGNQCNDDPAEAVGPPDCVELGCPINDCRVQLGDLGVLECENLNAPGGWWIVAVPGQDNDFTVFEGDDDLADWRKDSYDVYVENPAVSGDWVYAGTSPGGPMRFDLPVAIPYTNRVQIRDRGETPASPWHWGADIDAIGSGTPPILYCDHGWSPAKAEASVLGGGSGSATGSRGANLLFVLVVSVGAILLQRTLRRRSRS